MCNGCKTTIDLYEIETIGGIDKGKVIEWKKGCQCENIKLAREAVDNHKRMVEEKNKSVFQEHSLINRDLMQATMESYEAHEETQVYAKRVAIRYVEKFSVDESRNIIFSGSYGLGKSHLSKAIADEVMAKGFTAIFISVPKLLRLFRSSYNKDSEISEEVIFKNLESVDLLILDDLGAEKSSPWVTEKLFDIIDTRQGMNTIYTTNFDTNDLLKVIGERNFSRVLNNDSITVEMHGDNYRLKKMNTKKN